MTRPSLTVTAYFELDANGGDFFTLDDPVKGALDNVTYLLGGPVSTDITGYVRGYSVNRGRNRQLDEISVGVATVEANNFTRIFDPEYTAGDFYGDLLPGRRVTLALDGVTFFDGNIDDWDFAYDVSGESIVVFEVVDALGMLGAMEFSEWTATSGQLPGARLTAILNRSEVDFPSGQRDLDTGTSTLQGDLVSWGSNVLNYCQLVARSDLGMLFASRVNTLTFYGRNRSVTGVGAPILADDGTGIAYTNLTRARGTELLFNRVGVDREGESAIQQTVNDTASQTTYGVRSLTLSGLLMDSDSQSLDMANWLLGLYKDPDPRIATVTVALDALSDADRRTMLELDIGSVVRVKYTPNGVGTALDKFCMVEGLSPAGTALGLHRMTLALSNLADGFSGVPFILDSTEFGLLDTNVLAF